VLKKRRIFSAFFISRESIRINFLCLLTFFVSCGAKEEIYDVKGTIRSIDIESKKVIIAHDTIPGLMMPMVMPFPVLDLRELDQIKIGDSVHFKFIWTDTLPHANRFTVLGKGHIPEYDDFFREEYDELKVGKLFDDITLLDIDSSEVKLSQSDGRYRFISYIFSRCPMPNMCPAVIMKTNILADIFSKFKLIDFILVSFDYKYDKPSILKRNYATLTNGRDNLKLWSSSGKIDDVYKLVKQSGGEFWGVEEDKIGHTLKSVLVGPNRELLATWDGEDWKVKEVENGIRMFMK